MAYVSGFQHDLFISYAHRDDLPDREGEKGWVERFDRQLSVRLLKLCGEEVDVWRDRELRRAQPFDPVLERAVRGSTILILLLSNSYLNSDYCRQELAWFCDAAGGGPAGLQVGDFRRVFPVLLYNLPYPRWPEICQGMSGFRFCSGEGDSPGSPLDPDGEEFERELLSLRDELHAVFTALRERDREREPKGEGPEGEGRVVRVFLAATSDDLSHDRAYLKHRLGEQGIEVLPRIPPPYEPGEHAEVVRGAVSRAALSVHLLGRYPGTPLDEDEPERTYPLAQLELVRGEGRPQLVLRSSEPETEAYGAFVEALEQRPRSADELELVRAANRPEMLDAVLARCARIEETRQREAGGDCAFIDCHPRDLDSTFDLSRYLAGNRLAPITIPSADLDPMRAMSGFEANLRRARLFLVVFGRVARQWVEHRLLEALKLKMTHRLAFRTAVYAVPPHKETPDLDFSGLCPVVDNTERFDLGPLDGLLGQEP